MVLLKDLNVDRYRVMPNVALLSKSVSCDGTINLEDQGKTH